MPCVSAPGAVLTFDSAAGWASGSLAKVVLASPNSTAHMRRASSHRQNAHCTTTLPAVPEIANCKLQTHVCLEILNLHFAFCILQYPPIFTIPGSPLH